MTGNAGDVRSSVVELRQYTLHPGQTDTLIELFDREFLESQEACGMSVIGQFRDLDRRDRFVWLRGFEDMQSRAEALGAFYGGPAWAAHRDSANATMIDFDDVLLLKPTRAGAGFRLRVGDRPPQGAAERAGGMIAATIVPLAAGAAADFAELFETRLRPAMAEAGADVLASFVTDNSPNSYPRLPLRADATVAVWFTAHADEAAHRDHQSRLGDLASWREGEAAAARLMAGDRHTLRLQPTRRSLLRAAGATSRR